jgi:hypothetical protein
MFAVSLSTGPAVPKKGRSILRACLVGLFSVGLGLSTPAWSRERCLAFIETDRPGVDVSVPYGRVYRTVAKARQNALKRCARTNLAQEGWGELCEAWCVQARP